MKHIFSYFTIFLINIIACIHLNASQSDLAIVQTPISEVRPVSPDERPLPESATSQTTSESHQFLMQRIRELSVAANQASANRQMSSLPMPDDPWHFKVTTKHLDYLGGISAAAIFVWWMIPRKESDVSTRMPVMLGYTVGKTAFSVLGYLGSSTLLAGATLYTGYKVKRWLHKKCRSDLKRTKDEFEQLLNDHINEDNGRATVRASIDNDMCSAIDGLAQAMALMNARPPEISDHTPGLTAERIAATQAETQNVHTILDRVHGITEAVRTENKTILDAPLPYKVPASKWCCC